MFKGFDELFNDVIGTLQLTTRERAEYKSSLKNSIKRWRIKGLLKPDELPDKNHDLVFSWKVQHDKEMLSRSLELSQWHKYLPRSSIPPQFCGTPIFFLSE